MSNQCPWWAAVPSSRQGALAGSITHGGGGLGRARPRPRRAFLLGFVDDVLPGGLKAMHKLWRAPWWGAPRSSPAR